MPIRALRVGTGREPGAGSVVRGEAILRGSLAFTDKGHVTDRAVVLGLLGFRPEILDPEEAERRMTELRAKCHIDVPGLGRLAFDADQGVAFDYGTPLPCHASGLVFRAYDAAGSLLPAETYYSIGGGFVLNEAELQGATLKSDDAE